MDLTKMFLDFLGIKSRLQFYVAVKYQLQINSMSVLLHRKMATFDGFN